MRPYHRVLGPTAVAALLLSCVLFTQGCSALKPAAKSATKGAIAGSFDEIDAMDPALQERVVRKFLDNPAVHDAAHDLLRSAVTGTLDGMTEAERTGRVNAFVDAILASMRKEGGAAMDDVISRFGKELAPILRSLVAELVSSASGAMREAAARDLPVIMSAFLDSAVRAFAVAASAGSEQMRAQAKEFAEHDLGPIAGALSEQVARQAIIGVREGIHRELDLKDPEVRDGMREIGIGLAQGIAQGTPTSPFTTTFAIASFSLAFLLFLAICAIVALYSRARTSANVIAILAQRLDGHDKAGAGGPSPVGAATAQETD
jgi:hypothetical protein